MKYIFLFLFFAIISTVFAQNDLSGRITDTDGNPIPGATIFHKKSGRATTSNSNGYFSLENIEDGKSIVRISSLGMTTIDQEIDLLLKDKKIEIMMEESVSRLNDIVVISGGEEGIKDVPGSVHYLSPRELNKFNYTDVNRALRNVPGVNIQEEDGFGLRPNIGLRATGVERSSKINLMEDGILMAPAPYVAPAAYYFPTMGRMQGIEVMKGSSQIKHGPFTTGGSLNLISTQIPDQFSGNFNVSGGTFGTNQLHVNVGSSEERYGYMLEYFQYGSDGFKKLDIGGNTGFDKRDYLGKFMVRSKADATLQQSLTLKIGAANENSDETYLGLTDADFKDQPNRRYFGSQNDNMATEHFQVSLLHELRFNKGLKLSTSVYRNEFKRNWYKLDKIADTSGSTSIANILSDPESYSRELSIIKGVTTTDEERLLVKANNRSYYSQGIQFALKQSIKSENIEHHIDYGLRIHEDQMDRFQWVDAYSMQNGVMIIEEKGEAGTESNRIESAMAIAGYVQYKLRISKWTVTSGVRYENITLDRMDYGKNDPERTESDLSTRSNTVEVILPGIAVDYRISSFMGVFAGYHKGFAPPGTKEGTKPEESDNFEVGLKYRKNNAQVQLIGFYNYYENLLGADLNAAGGNGSGDLFNGGKAEAMGIEFLAGFNLLSRNNLSSWSLPVQFTYTHSDAHFLTSFESEFDGWGDVEEGDQLPYLANHQFGIQFGVEYKRVMLNLSGKYMDAMRTEAGQGELVKSESTDAYFVSDISLNVQINQHMTLFSSVTNLTDEVYIVSRRPAGVRPGLPRLAMIGLKARF